MFFLNVFCLMSKVSALLQELPSETEFLIFLSDENSFFFLLSNFKS